MKQKWKRPLALLLSVAMMFSMSGTPVSAEDVKPGASAVCPHHVHDETCGYYEGTPCTHEHADDCYTLVTQCVHEHTAECYSDGMLPAEGEEKAADACTHVCSEESGCITKELNCPHVHDATCGYSEGSPCTFDAADCELCNPTDSGEPEAPAECTCETLCMADSVNPDCPVCAQDIAACQGETPAPEEAPEAQARHWQFEENPDGFLIVEENGVFYADAPGGNIPLEAVVSMLPQSLTVEGEADGEPVTVAISGWECPDYQCVEDSWPQEGSYTFTAQVETDLQLDPAPAVTLRLTNMVQTLAAVSNPTLDLANGSIWITPNSYYQYSGYKHTAVSSVPYTGTITITGSNSYGFSCVTITGSDTYDIVLKDAQLNPWYASSEPIDSTTYGLLIANGAQVTLTLEGTSSVTGTRTADEYDAMDGISVTERSSLTIQGSGTLNAYGGDSARKLNTDAHSGAGLYINASFVTITGDAKVNLYGGHYSDYDLQYITAVGQGCTLNESILTLEGNVQVTAQGIFAFAQTSADSWIYVKGGRHAFTGLCLVVENNIDTPLLEIQGGTVDLHLLGTDKDLSGVTSQFSYNGGIAVKGGDVTFRREDCDFRTSLIQVGAQACIFEGSNTDSASFKRKTTGTSYPSLSAKYIRILFDDTSYTLTVESDGTGSSGTGSYTPGTEVPLNAGTKEGYALRRWTLTNGKGLLRSPTSADATFVMYDSDATVTAEFDKLYGLNVEGGSITNPAGQSQFLSGTQVTLQANKPSETMVFDQWTIESGSGSFGDAESAATTFTTGEADTQIKANFVQGYDLTVVNGTGSGLYKPGAQVAIQAETREGVEFSHWDMTGNVQIADVNAASTTVTMGSEDATVTAVYQESGVLGDFVVTGTDDGYSFSGDILDFTGSGEYTVRMKAGITETKDRIRIKSGSPTITITDLTLTNNIPFEIQDGNVTLKLDGANTFSTSHSNYAALQKGESGTLTITSVQGDGSTYGSLTIRSGKNGAGIGGRGSYDTDKGPASSANITINGGTLNITTQSGAGIGGGGSSHCTDLLGGINGGNGSNITINGGDITIRKGSSAAGIGGGNIYSGVGMGNGGDGSNITINGGKLLIVSSVNRSYRCGSALGAGKNDERSDTYGNYSDIFVMGSPTVFNLWAMDGSTEVDYLDQRGSDGRVENIPDFEDKGCARIEYGGATATSVKIQPTDAMVVPGTSQRFTATVVASGSWTLDWTVSGNLSNETTITDGGLLTVGANQTVTSLTVTATISGTSISDSVTVTISKGADAMVTKAPAAVTGLTYTSEAQNLVAAGEAEGGTLVYSLEIDGNYDAAIPTGTNAGSYTVFYYVKGDANHNDTAKEQVEVTINKAKPTVSDVAVSSPNTIYNAIKLSAITLTHTGTPGTVALDADQALTVGEGSYNWTFIPNDSNNYETTTGSIRLTVYEPPQEVDGVYQIDSVADLFWFAGLVNGTLEDVEQDAAASAVLTADIDLSGETWTPIGNYDQSSRPKNKYAGTFDGADHTIEGLKIESSADWQGFVGYLGEGGVIENLTLGETCSVTGGVYVGGICGYNNGGTIESCTNAGTVTGSSDVGGVCGLSNTTITGCTNEGTVTGSGRWVGGVCGLSRGTVTGCTNAGTVTGSNNVGGIVGYTDDGAIENCQNSGSVTGNGEDVGGICGFSNQPITNCANTGDITGGKYTGGICGWNNAGAITGCTNKGAVNGSGDLGGICGHNEGTVKNCTNTGAVNNGDKNTVGGICGYSKTDVTGCTNKGDITGKTYVGGIVGYTDDGAIETCQNSGSVTGNGEDVGGICGFSNQPITNCANTGDITGSNVVGGVCGLMVSSKVTISNCYNTGTVTGTTSGGIYGKNGRGQNGDGQGTITNCYYQSEETTSTQEGATPKTAEKFASGEVTWLLNGSSSDSPAWYQTLGENGDKTPVLDSTHGTVYCGASCSGKESYSNSPVNAEHDYNADGFCTCGQYQPANLNGGVYEIANAGQLYWFAALVNGDKTHAEFDSQDSAASAKLLNDITLNENVLNADGALNGDGSSLRIWTPMGSDSNRYVGTFDGNGHTIYGLYIPNGGSVGLVGFLGQGGVLQGITLADGYVRAQDGSEYAGGLCARNWGTITNCHNGASLVGWGRNNIGGICGCNEDGGIIQDCTNSGRIQGVQKVGGIVGWNYLGHTVTGCTNSGYIIGESNCTGGICGDNNGSTVFTNCTNTGTVNGGQETGGICGTSNRTLTGCVNTGNVTGTYNMVGGICGHAGSVENCANRGTVTGTYEVGGICGYLDYNGTLQSCYSTGTVTATEQSGSYAERVGAIGGHIGTGSVANCYWLDGSAGKGIGSGSGEATAKIADEFASGEVAYLLNGSTSEGDLAWYQNLDNGQTVDEVPVLDSSHGTVYHIEGEPVSYSNDPNSQPPVIISVDITWGDLSFTYSDGTWNANTHTYDGAGWTVDTEEGNSITVDNTGNTGVNVSYAYQDAETGITGSFLNGESAPVSGPVSLPKESSSTVYLVLTGKPEKTLDNIPIGAVTVTIGGESE